MTIYVQLTPLHTFTNFLNGIYKVTDQILDSVGGGKNDHGYETFKVGLIPSKIGLGGALKLDGRINSTLGWTFKSNDNCLPSEGADSRNAEFGIKLTLKISASVQVEVFMIKFKIN